MTDRPRLQSTFRFLLPSLLGVLIFLVPVRWNGQLTIGIGVVTQWIKSLMGNYALWIVVAVLVTTSVLTLLATVVRLPSLRASSRASARMSWFSR